METKISPIKFRINHDINIPENIKNSFQSIFSYLRKKLQVKYSRKSHIDSLLKKSKGKFFKTIHDSLKICLNIIINRLPQKFITNITIAYNQKFLNKKIIEIYREFNLLPSLNEIISKKLCNEDKIDIIKELLNTDFYNLYETYIESDRFKRDIIEVKTHDGKKIKKKKIILKRKKKKKKMKKVNQIVNLLLPLFKIVVMKISLIELI